MALRMSLRRLASQAAALPKEPPVQMYGIAGRYANAIYAAAAKKDALFQVEADLKLFAETLEKSPALKAWASDPAIARPKKAADVQDLLASAGACDTTKNALATIAEGGRMGEMPKIISMYGELMNAAKGEVTAVITLAKPVPAEQMKQIEASLADFVVRDALGERGGGGGEEAPGALAADRRRARPQDPGQKVSIQTKIDPGLINGMTVEVRCATCPPSPPAGAQHTTPAHDSTLCSRTAAARRLATSSSTSPSRRSSRSCTSCSWAASSARDVSGRGTRPGPRPCRIADCCTVLSPARRRLSALRVSSSARIAGCVIRTERAT